MSPGCVIEEKELKNVVRSAAAYLPTPGDVVEGAVILAGVAGFVVLLEWVLELAKL